MAPADDLVEPDPRPMPAEFQYLMVVVALFALLLLAGVPGRELEEAGEHTAGAPPRAWATRWSRQVQAVQTAQAAQGAQAAPETQLVSPTGTQPDGVTPQR